MCDEEIRPDESNFAFLQRCSWASAELARNYLRDALERFPRKQRPDLVTRLRSANNEQHDAAGFEIVVHDYLLKRNCIVLDYEPNYGSGRPDFLARTKSGLELLVEATVIGSKSKEEVAQEKHSRAVHYTLDSVPTPNLILSLRLRGQFSSAPNLNRVKHAFQSWVGNLPSVASFHYEESGATIDVDVVDETAEERVGRNISIYSYASYSGWISDTKSIRSKIKRKASQLAAIDKPAILAFKMSQFSAKPRDVFAAMLGDEQFTFSLDTGKLISRSRGPNAALIWQGVPQNTSLSGFLTFDKVVLWDPDQLSTVFYQNPWAARTYDGHDFAEKRWLPNLAKGEFELTDD